MKNVSFFSNSGLTSNELHLPNDRILIHGESLDDRGFSACECTVSSSRVKLGFDPEDMSLTLGGTTKTSDFVDELIRPYDIEAIVLEATTLGFAELYCAANALVRLGAKSINILYVEPRDYARIEHGSRQSALSESILGYRPIPNGIIDLSSPDLQTGVFFVGFEPERFDRAFEEYQMISSKEIKLIFGVPAYHPGWELDSIVPHLNALRSHDLEVDYCSAIDPEAAYDCLEKTRQSLGLNKLMFVAPVGPKPCGIASAIFASVYHSQVGVLYDHPKRKPNRTTGVGRWHMFRVEISH